MVRVASDTKQLNAGRWSLIGAVSVGLVALLVLSLSREKPPQSAPQRTLLTYPVLWTCEIDPTHEFTANGRFDPMPCRYPKCDGLCSIRMTFVCEAHREKFDAWVRFERVPAESDNAPDSAKERITTYRYEPAAKWLEAKSGHVPCPRPGCPSNTHPARLSWSSGDAQSESQDPNTQDPND